MSKTKVELGGTFGELKEYLDEYSGETILFRKIDRTIWQKHKAGVALYDRSILAKGDQASVLAEAGMKAIGEVGKEVVVSHTQSELDVLAEANFDLFEDIGMHAILWKNECDNEAKKKQKK